MEAVVDAGEVILNEITVIRSRIASDEARLAQKMLEFEDLREVQASRLPERDRQLAVDAIRDELSLTVVEPVGTVYGMLSQLRIVRDRLPSTWAVFTEGRIDARRIGVIGAAANQLSDNNYSFIELDYQLADYAVTHTAAQLRAKVKRFVARIEPDRAASRARAERDRRAVWFHHADDGMAYLTTYLPSVDVMKIDNLLSTLAKNAPAEGRTFDAKPADALVQQLLTMGDGTVSSGAIIGVTIPVTSLAGLSEEPGEAFDGSFALPADLVRELATEPGTLFHRIFTDPLGRILDITELGRFPSSKLRVGVQIRDGNCLFPTCNQPAIASDLDHQIPHPRGPTTGDNLGALCRRHHQMKTAGILDPYTASVRDAA